MTFENPSWLYITAILTLFLVGLIRYGLGKRDRLLSQFVARRLITVLSQRAQSGRLLLKGLCAVLAISLIGIAIAQPQYGTRSVKRTVRGIDLIFAVDCSKSMLASDLSPNRLQRAKLAVRDLVELLQGDRIGLVAFAGQAFLQTPLTLDYGAFTESLRSLSPNSMSRGGSDIGAALREAAAAFPADDNFKTILLLTDGEDLSGDALAAAEELADQSIRVYTVGIGTQTGELLRQQNQLGNTITLRDASGSPVLSKLDEASLRKISLLTEAQYRHINQMRSKALYADIRAITPLSDRELELTEIAIDRYQWFLLPALILLMLEMLLHRRARPKSSVTLVPLMALFNIFPIDVEAQISADGVSQISEPTKQETAPKQNITAKFESAQQAILAENFDLANQLYTEVLTQSQDLSLQADACYNQALIAHQQSRNTYQSGDLATALKQMQVAESHAAASLEIFPQEIEYQTVFQQINAAKKAIQDLLDEQNDSSEQNDSQESDESNTSESSDAASSQEQASDSKNSEDAESDNPRESEDTSETQDPAQQSTQSDNSENSQAAPEAESDSNQQPTEENAEQTPDTAPEEAADSPQQTAADAPELPNDGDPESAQPVPGVEQGAADSAQNQAAATPMAMTEQEAQALLNSLSGQERILPMMPRSSQPPQRSNRDW
jgi:Ca-activated chloride channel family protein